MAGRLVTCRLVGVEKCLDELAAALSDEVTTAVDVVGQDAALDAARNHNDDSPGRERYCNRTGDLTASIEALAPMGDLVETGITGGVVAGMEYASYVEEGTDRARAFPYLSPAQIATEPRLQDQGERALDRAAGTDGWHKG